MLVLYVVFVVSLIALVWAAIAVTRHIVRHGAVRERPEHEMAAGKPLDPPEDLLSQTGTTDSK